MGAPSGCMTWAKHDLGVRVLLQAARLPLGSCRHLSPKARAGLVCECV